MTAKGPSTPQPPTGGREVETRYNFYTFKKKGEAILCTLAGMTTIKNQRNEDRPRYLAVIGNDTVILPDHMDLMRKLDNIKEQNGGAMGVKVWIQFQDKQKIEGVANPMAIYRVVDYGTPAKK